MYNIKKHIIDYKNLNYAAEAEMTNDNIIDCSFGINPYGCSDKIIEVLKEITVEDITHYPESSKQIKDAIVEFWKDADLDNENIFLGNGSMGILYSINYMLAERDDKMLGYGPQFAAYVGGVIRNGVNYEYTELKEEEKYRFDHNEMIKAIKDEHKFLYIDNPNNPTGQIIPLEEIEDIVKAAKIMKKIVVIDEAYGDYMDDNNSAINLVSKYNNIVVTRTMSKGLGLAGIRAGYVVADKFFIEQYSKIGEIFDCSTQARYMSCVALQDKEFIDDCIEKIKINKQKLLSSIKHLEFAHTSPETPIMMLIHPDKNLNLYEELLKKDVKTVPLENFIGAGKNCVRLRIPTNTDELISRLNN